MAARRFRDRLESLGWLLGIIGTVTAGALWFINKEALVRLNLNVFFFEIVAVAIIASSFRFRSRIADYLHIRPERRGFKAVGLYPVDLVVAGTSRWDKIIAVFVVISYIVLFISMVAYVANTISFVSNRYNDKLRQSMLAEAVVSDKRGDYSTAIGRYKQVLARFPDDIRNDIIRARISSLSIQSKVGGRRLAALTNGNTDDISAAYLDIVVSVCSISSDSLPCKKIIGKFSRRTKQTIALIDGDTGPCSAIIRKIDYRMLVDEKDLRWLGIGRQDYQTLCNFVGASNSRQLVQYLRIRWRQDELRLWLHANK